MRCCLASLDEYLKATTAPSKEGDTLICRYCNSPDGNMIFRDGAWEWNRSTGPMTIEWKRYIVNGHGTLREERWLGRVNNRPLYVIQLLPLDDPTEMELLDIVTREPIATAAGDGAVEYLKKRAGQHRRELTGGEFP